MSPQFWKVGLPIALAISAAMWYGLYRLVGAIWPFQADN